MDATSCAYNSRMLRELLPSCIRNNRRISAPLHADMPRPISKHLSENAVAFSSRCGPPYRGAKIDRWDVEGSSSPSYPVSPNVGPTTGTTSRPRPKNQGQQHLGNNTRPNRKSNRFGGDGAGGMYSGPNRVVTSQNMNAQELNLFRTQICPRKTHNDSCTLEECCPYSHCLSWHRRNPQITGYRPGLCPNVVFSVGPNRKMKVRNYCRRGRLCLYSHTKEEQMYHPLVYKTHLCRDWPNCNKHFCPFAHGVNELRSAQHVNFRLALGPEKPELPMEAHRASLASARHKGRDEHWDVDYEQKCKYASGRETEGKSGTRKYESGLPNTIDGDKCGSTYAMKNDADSSSLSRHLPCVALRNSSQSDSTTTTIGSTTLRSDYGGSQHCFEQFETHHRDTERSFNQHLDVSPVLLPERQDVVDSSCADMLGDDGRALNKQNNVNEDLLNIVAAGMVLLMQGNTEMGPADLSMLIRQDDTTLQSGQISCPQAASSLTQALDFLQSRGEELISHSGGSSLVGQRFADALSNVPLTSSSDTMQPWSMLQQTAALEFERNLGHEEVGSQSALWDSRDELGIPRGSAAVKAADDRTHDSLCRRGENFGSLSAEFGTEFSNESMMLTPSDVIALAGDSYGRIMNELSGGALNSNSLKLPSSDGLPDVPVRQPYFCLASAVLDRDSTLKRTNQSSTTIGGCSLGSEQSSVLSFDADRIFREERWSLEYGTSRGTLLQQHSSAPDLTKLSSLTDAHPAFEEFYSSPPEFRPSVSLQRISDMMLAAEFSDMADSSTTFHRAEKEAMSSCGTCSVSLKSPASNYTATSSP